MRIRQYQPGDEQAQARIYNIAAASLPAFKPATAEEIGRRYRTSDPDPTSKLYALDGDAIIGYAVFNPNGRISYPWCLPDALHARVPLLEAVLSGLRERGCREAWATYRNDWEPVLAFLREHGFVQIREMVNYVAELSQLPRTPIPEGQETAQLDRADLPAVLQLAQPISDWDDTEGLENFFFQNPYFKPDALYVLKETHGKFLGMGVAVVNSAYADPTKLDAAMPCFRLGAIGTESERHKRVNGMFSCAFTSPAAAEALLGEAVRRFEKAGLSHAAAQTSSDRSELCAFYDRYFRRQGAFPILSRRVD